MDKKDSIEQISNYYTGIDEETLNNISKNNINIKKLIKLSTISNVKVLNKYNKTWKLKNKDKIINDCDKIKNKQLKSSGSLLTNLAKLSHNYKIKDNVRYIYDELDSKLSNINKIIYYANKIESYSEEYKSKEKLSKKNKIKENTIKKHTNKENTNNNKLIDNKSFDNLSIIKLNDIIKNISDTYSLSEHYIECYSNY
jgi:hypothetical protein